MRLPGFNAEVALYRTRNNYRVCAPPAEAGSMSSTLGLCGSSEFLDGDHPFPSALGSANRSDYLDINRRFPGET